MSFRKTLLEGFYDVNTKGEVDIKRAEVDGLPHNLWARFCFGIQIKKSPDGVIDIMNWEQFPPSLEYPEEYILKTYTPQFNELYARTGKVEEFDIRTAPENSKVIIAVGAFNVQIVFVAFPILETNKGIQNSRSLLYKIRLLIQEHCDITIKKQALFLGREMLENEAQRRRQACSQGLS